MYITASSLNALAGGMALAGLLLAGAAWMWWVRECSWDWGRAWRLRHAAPKWVIAAGLLLAAVPLIARIVWGGIQRKVNAARERSGNAKRLRDTKKRHKAATDERNKQVGRLNDAARRAAEDAAASTPTPDARPESDEDRSERLNALREGMWDE